MTIKINEKPEWEELLEKIRKRGNIQTDTELAEILNVKKQAVSKWITGKSEPSFEAQARMKDLLKYQGARNAILILFPKKIADEIISWNNKITRRWNTRKTKEEK